MHRLSNKNTCRLFYIFPVIDIVWLGQFLEKNLIKLSLRIKLKIEITVDDSDVHFIFQLN